MGIFKIGAGVAFAAMLVFFVATGISGCVDKNYKEDAQGLIDRHCVYIGVTSAPGNGAKYNVFQCDKNEIELTHIRFPEKEVK